MELALRPAGGGFMPPGVFVFHVVHYFDAGVQVCLLLTASILAFAAVACCLGAACRRSGAAPAPRLPAKEPQEASPPRQVSGFAVPLLRRRPAQARRGWGARPDGQ